MPYSGQVFIVTKKECIDLKLLYICNSIFSLFVMSRWEIYFVYVFLFKSSCSKTEGASGSQERSQIFAIFSFYLFIHLFFSGNKVAVGHA